MNCPKCGKPAKCLSGCSAHPLNWYCSDEEGCGWQAWTAAVDNEIARRKQKEPVMYDYVVVHTHEHGATAARVKSRLPDLGALEQDDPRMEPLLEQLNMDFDPSRGEDLMVYAVGSKPMRVWLGSDQPGAHFDSGRH